MSAVVTILLSLLRPIFEVIANAFFKVITEPDKAEMSPDPEPVLETLDPGLDDGGVDPVLYELLEG